MHPIPHRSPDSELLAIIRRIVLPYTVMPTVITEYDPHFLLLIYALTTAFANISGDLSGLYLLLNGCPYTARPWSQLWHGLHTRIVMSSE